VIKRKQLGSQWTIYERWRKLLTWKQDRKFGELQERLRNFASARSIVKRDWEQAQMRFPGYSGRHADDGPSACTDKRCQEYLFDERLSDGDGVFTMTTVANKPASVALRETSLFSTAVIKPQAIRAGHRAGAPATA